jgi:serine/threonine protein phosphatase PrpC
MVTATASFRAAGASDVGCQRLVNEDRFHVDVEGGVFIVVDGVGGQAAGGRAADTALAVIRTRLARGTGPLAGRIRDAIAAANNEVHRQAASRPEWHGMACVLTVAVIDGPRVVVGHVGDSRLYKLRDGTLQKITSDHSPVGEREDAGELTETAAMRHPRRHEVYRDVGSEPHQPGDADFIEIRETAWEPDAALLLCSDGLTDLVAADTIRQLVAARAGHPERVAQALVAAANDAGGRDNVTVVYVEGPEFARRDRQQGGPSGRLARQLIAVLLIAAAAAAGWRAAGYPVPVAVTNAIAVTAGNVIVVAPGESIEAALSAAAPGATVLVEPGEYRERLTLRSSVRLLSRVSRAAVLRLPDTATDEDAAVTAVNVTGAEIAGFTILGDAATPLGTGVRTRSAGVRLLDLDVSGAARVAIDLGPGQDVVLAASEVHDNPGAGLALRGEATARVVHNEFRNNASSEDAPAPILLERGARPLIRSNVFRGLDPRARTLLDPVAFAALTGANLFPDAGPAPAPAPGRGRGR